MATRVTVLGDGGWGTAIAILLAEKGHEVCLWGIDALYLIEMEGSRENDKFLPGFTLPENIRFEAEMTDAIADAEVIVMAIPTQFLRSALQQVPDLIDAIPESTRILSLAKGIEQRSGVRPSEIISSLLRRKDIAVLSGPSHAEEVAQKLPCSVTIAAPKQKDAQALQELFCTPTFRAYTSTDVIGVELGGALKNVIAVAVGICEGLKLGDNARSALMTRGLAEMSRLGIALGGKPETFAGLSGMGDLITTCVSPHGRNRAVGLALAGGTSLEDYLLSTNKVSEGVHTCVSVRELARVQGIEMPITDALYSILYDGQSPLDAVNALMTREPKAE
ncbi:MAG: NAD(P)H-dependent glycerol-3-phosphate dehydrogenase [Planctomycetota bacterium]|jgi:glycerol-3-phosphate dehydrogenase (NAD(P)+)